MPTWSIGFSLSGGYDAPGNVALAGARVRAAREWERSRIEASAGLYYQLRQFHQRSGAVVGVAYYPLPWVALVSQVDVLPTPHLAEWLPTRGGYGADTSVGLRFGEGAALVSWGLTALGGLFVAMIGSTGPMGL